MTVQRDPNSPADPPGETVLRYRYRAYPCPNASIAPSRTVGSCRVAFNDAVAARESAHRAGLPFPKTGELSSKLMTEAKKCPEPRWLSEVSAVALQQALADVEAAYRNFFSPRAGTRKGRTVGHPRFRSTHDSRPTARFTANARFKVTQVHERRAELTLPTVGRTIPFVRSRPLPPTPTSVTVIREADGRVYLSFVVGMVDRPSAPTGRVCGIDGGLSHFATVVTVETATGEETSETIENPRYLRRKERALARSQRSLSRRQKGSKYRAKQTVRVARLHRLVRESRLDHAHQQAAGIVGTHDIVCVEDLAVAGTVRSNLAKSVTDTGMAQSIRVLSKKADRRGKTLVTIGRWFPSTRACSACTDLPGPKGLAELGVRPWTCGSYGVPHDRDTNAARNILTQGLRMLESEHSGVVTGGQSETQNACGADVRPPPAPLAVGREAGRANEGGQSCTA